jgi:hypothetical protein
MRLEWLVVSISLAGCVDLPDTSSNVAVQLIAVWDESGCGPPHRIAFALADDAGDSVARSAPCDAGTLVFDVPRLGTYSGQVYAWTLDAGSGAADDVSIDVIAAMTRWDLPRVP